MAESTARSTRVSILMALRSDPSDQAAWSAFVDRYGPQIHAWCLRWKLQEADAQDVTQMVLVKLVRHLPGFAYDPARSFRGWLKTLTQHAWSDYCEGRRRAGVASADSRAWERLQNIEARDDLVVRLKDEFDREMLDEAMARVRLRVDPAKWEVFRLLALEGLSGAEVGERLAMKVATAFVVRSKVQRMIQEELRKLEGEPSECEEPP